MTISVKDSDPLTAALQEPPPKYQAENQIALFPEIELRQGEIFPAAESNGAGSEPHLFYQHPNGRIYVGDSIRWLASLESESVDLIVADPPYNINKAEWDTF
jgi:site-specific DNA-methyltransferase (adenine-specific)